MNYVETTLSARAKLEQLKVIASRIERFLNSGELPNVFWDDLQELLIIILRTEVVGHA